MRLLFSLITLAAFVLLPSAHVRAQTPITLDDLNSEETATRISGFGVAGVTGGTGLNTTFTAGKLALGVFRELNDRTWVFGQLTTSVSAEDDASDEAHTEIEIDNLIINVAPRANLSLAFGKLDTPLGFERDDEPLNLQATTSNNFEFARPPKLVGALARWSVGRRTDISGWIANGWQGDLEPNAGKTVGGRVGTRPSDHASIGAGFLLGPEGAAAQEQTRYLVNVDYALQADDAWVFAGEANYGGNGSAADRPAERWYGATATVFRQVGRSFGVAGRIDGFNDHDGARTGLPQTLTSLTLTPIYFVGAGREGIFATIEHTTLRIPRFQVRTDVRWDHRHFARQSVSDAADEGWTASGVLQLVATF